MSTDGDRNLFVPRGEPESAHGPRIVLPSQAYSKLIEGTRTRLPSETTGALVGTLQDRKGRAEVLITGAVPVGLVSSGPGVAPGEEEWAELKARLASEAEESAGLDERIVGWFYADPGIGIFPPRIDAAAVHAALAPEAAIFLLLNPSSDRGVFYTLHAGSFVPVKGFYEALDERGEEAIIPWDGKVPGADVWLSGQGAAADTGRSTSPLTEEMVKAGSITANGRRTRLIAGAVLGLVVAAALVGALFIFGRERQATPLPSPVETQTIGQASPLPTTQATTPASPPQAVPSQVVPGQLPPPTPVTTIFVIAPTSPTGVMTTIPAITATLYGAIGTATVAQPTSTPIQPVTYKVSSGDSLSIIADRFNTTVEAIMAANNLNSTVIVPGQVLTIPAQVGLSGVGSATPAITPTGVVTSVPPANPPPTEVIPRAVPSSVSTAGTR
jgi:LysM repeat protein